MRSWGGLPTAGQTLRKISWVDELEPGWQTSTLPVGFGRSYGDSGLAASGEATSTVGLNRLLGFDVAKGILRCEAGVSLGEILQVSLGQGWILPVLPGTQVVSVAGAIANDIHGKNHYRAGTFGRHVRSLDLQRSDGQVLHCSPSENQEMFRASLGGLGLTGIIVAAELQLQRITGADLDAETIKFGDLEEFFSLSEESASAYEYSVGWIDCLSPRMRGHYSRANHTAQAVPHRPLPVPGIPFELPFTPINRLTLRTFNSLYYHRQRSARRSYAQSWRSWFFPLDGIANWNRLYGRLGFRQYQCVVPAEAISELLGLIRRSGQGSFLAVIKTFGGLAAPGLISFPRPGVTLALDFPWRGQRTLSLFAQLDAVVRAHDGAIYPAKDAHMPAADFRRAYPGWEQLETQRDPALMSQFWQRVTGES